MQLKSIRFSLRTLLLTLGLTLAAGGSLQAAAFLGSVAASIEASYVGNHPIDLEELLSRAAMLASREATRLAS